MSEFSPYEPPVQVAPEPAPQRPPEPTGWLLWPARLIALGIVLPVRVLWEALRATGRGTQRILGAGLRLLGRALAFVVAPVATLLLLPIRVLGRWAFCPLTAFLARHLGRLLALLLTQVVLPVLAALNATIAALGHALAAAFRALQAAVLAIARSTGRALAALVAGVGWLLHRLVVVPIAALARLIARCLSVLGGLLVVPFALLWRWVLRPVGAGLAFALLAIGMTLWRYLLRPVLVAVGAVLGAVGGVLGALGAAIIAAGRAIGRSIGWAWHTSGRFLVLLGRILATPFVWLYRHVLTPVGHAIRGVWRTCVVAPLAVIRRTAAAASASVRRTSAQARVQVSAQVRVLFGRAR